MIACHPQEKPMPLQNVGDIPGIRSGKLPPAVYPRQPPALGLRLRNESWACGVSIDGKWIPCSRLQFDASVNGVPQVTITIPALDLTIETETERALSDAA
jgi:hypothetical protein